MSPRVYLHDGAGRKDNETDISSSRSHFEAVDSKRTVATKKVASPSNSSTFSLGEPTPDANSLLADTMTLMTSSALNRDESITEEVGVHKDLASVKKAMLKVLMLRQQALSNHTVRELSFGKTKRPSCVLETSSSSSTSAHSMQSDTSRQPLKKRPSCVLEISSSSSSTSAHSMQSDTSRQPLKKRRHTIQTSNCSGRRTPTYDFAKPTRLSVVRVGSLDPMEIKRNMLKELALRQQALDQQTQDGPTITQDQLAKLIERAKAANTAMSTAEVIKRAMEVQCTSALHLSTVYKSPRTSVVSPESNKCILESPVLLESLQVKRLLGSSPCSLSDDVSVKRTLLDVSQQYALQIQTTSKLCFPHSCLFKHNDSDFYFL